MRWRGRLPFAAGAAALAPVATVLRGKVIGKMDWLRGKMQSNDTAAVPEFRRTHVTAILINLVQLVVIVWNLMALHL